MGHVAVSGRNVPSWHVDATTLRALLEHLQGALAQPPSHDERLTALIDELTTLSSVRVTMTLGLRRREALRRLLTEPARNLRGVRHRANTKNSHSEALRFLLDPRKAPTIAPAALRSLVSRFRNPEKWRSAVRNALARGGVSVGREVVVENDVGESDTKGHFDLVVSGPGFVIGIESKVRASNNDERTSSYNRWSKSLRRVPLRAGVFLTPSGMPAANASASFRGVSCLELVGCLLAASAKGAVTEREERVLAAYLHTLKRRILRAEFNAILDAR